MKKIICLLLQREIRLVLSVNRPDTVLLTNNIPIQITDTLGNLNFQKIGPTLNSTHCCHLFSNMLKSAGWDFWMKMVLSFICDTYPCSLVQK